MRQFGSQAFQGDNSAWFGRAEMQTAGLCSLILALTRPVDIALFWCETMELLNFMAGSNDCKTGYSGAGQ